MTIRKGTRFRRVFYRGDGRDLPVGSVIAPYDTGRPHGKWDHCAWGYCAVDDCVYITTELMTAIDCARLNHGWVYRVAPIGPLGPDDGGEAGPHYTVRRALILARCAEPPSWAALSEDEFVFGLYHEYLGLLGALERVRQLPGDEIDIEDAIGAEQGHEIDIEDEVDTGNEVVLEDEVEDEVEA